MVLKSEADAGQWPALLKAKGLICCKAKGLNYGSPGQRPGNQRTKDIKPWKGEPMEQRALVRLGV